MDLIPVLVRHFLTVTRSDRFWLMVSEVSVHCEFVPLSRAYSKSEHDDNKSMCYRKVVHFMQSGSRVE